MFRTLTLVTALTAIALPAAAASEVRVSLVGKTEAQIRAEVANAAKEVCHSYVASPLEIYFADSCVDATVQRIMAEVAAMQVSKAAAATPTLTTTPVSLK